LSSDVFCGVKLNDFIEFIRMIKDKRGSIEVMNELKNILEEIDKDQDVESTVKSAIEQLEENKMHVYFAKDESEVEMLIKEHVGIQDIIILDDSFELLEHNIFKYVIENELNFTCINPSLCLEYRDARKISISNKLKYRLRLSKNDLEEIVKFFKDYSNFSTVGIGTPDFVSSDLGNLFITEDFWGRSILCTTPRRNIFLIGIERVVKDFFLASRLAFLKGKALDKDFNVQIHIVNFPSRTGDIEKIVVYGAHGPRDVTTVFIDNGRLDALKNLNISISLSIMMEFVNIFYPELVYLANCMGIPEIDPLKIKVIINNKKMKLNIDNVAILLSLLINIIPNMNGIFWKDRLIEAYKSIYKEIEPEISDVGAVQNRVQELENIINKVWGGA